MATSATPGGFDARENQGRLRASLHPACPAISLGASGDTCERPRHDPKLDVDWVRDNGRIAPYTCRTFDGVRDVDIEHIVAWAEARRSGLPCARAAEFVNDPLNITVAYPRLNRHEKSDKDIADWQPPDNACWFAERVRAVKAKYALTMDGRERQALEAVLAGCTAEQRQAWHCPATQTEAPPVKQAALPDVQRSRVLKVFSLCGTECYRIHLGRESRGRPRPRS